MYHPEDEPSRSRIHDEISDELQHRQEMSENLSLPPFSRPENVPGPEAGTGKQPS
jgi:hypothetical protein